MTETRCLAKQVTAVFFTLLVIAAQFSAQLPSAQASSVSSAPLSTQSGSVSGMVRVSLASLGSPSSLTLTTVGEYRVGNDVSIGSGSRIAVEVSGGGIVSLKKDGTAIVAGTELVLQRTSTSESNGLKIAQGKKPEQLYPGDMTLFATGGRLSVIMHVYIENYLYGVLPYEMGNDAHIEALKAQAVAARTYTVRMMQSRAGNRYDVVDTTSDQVYYGTPSGNANCVAAVNATKGIVIKNGSQYTATYYGASNGGQIESIVNAWGTSGLPYLAVKDDPFDLANTASVVKRYTVPSAPGSTPLGVLLKDKAAAAVRSSHGNVAGSLSIQQVRSITPHTPKFAPPSKLYTQMDFALTVTFQGSAGNAVTTDVTVTCNIFSELESLLGMSIQSSSNELWSVAKSGSRFVLEARRYGHGIGMSQRGAMQMGRQGYSYDQILGFYYTGCTRVNMSFANQVVGSESTSTIPLDEVPSQGADNAGDTENIGDTGDISTPESGQTAEQATVQANGYLNLRAAGSFSAAILTRVLSGTVLRVLSTADGWAHVQYGATVAYASMDFLVFSGTVPDGEVPGSAPETPNTIPASLPEPGTSLQTAVVATPQGSLNLRILPMMGSPILTTIPRGSQVDVASTAGEWAAVSYRGISGYAMVGFLAFSAPLSNADSEAAINPPGSVADVPSYPSQGYQAWVNTPSGALNLRAMGSVDAKILRSIPRSATVTVLEEHGEWSYVEYSDRLGYVMNRYLARYDEISVPGNQAQAGNQSGNAETIHKPTPEPDNAQANADSSTQQSGRETRATVSPAVGKTMVTLWQARDTAGRALGDMLTGEAVQVLTRDAEWSQVICRGQVGYCLTRDLSFLEE